jgi:hypothetical protein
MLKMIWTGKTLPMASISILQAVHDFGGADAPFFILGLSKKMKTLNFLLPFPLSLEGVFVIGDPIYYYYYCDPRKGGQWRKTPR